MKKAILMALALVLVAVPAVFAAGSVTVTQYYLSQDKNVLVIKLACVGDAANGSVPNTTIAGGDVSAKLPYDYDQMGYYFYELWTVAGTVTAPDAADITVNDALSSQIFDEDDVLQATGTTEGTVDKYRSVTSELTVITANQGTASATWDTYIKLVK